MLQARTLTTARRENPKLRKKTGRPLDVIRYVTAWFIREAPALLGEISSNPVGDDDDDDGLDADAGDDDDDDDAGDDDDDDDDGDDDGDDDDADADGARVAPRPPGPSSQATPTRDDVAGTNDAGRFPLRKITPTTDRGRKIALLEALTERRTAVAADSVSVLRQVDVDRVLLETPPSEQAAVAWMLGRMRPDLQEEIDAAMKELSGGKDEGKRWGWVYDAVPPFPGDRLPGEATGAHERLFAGVYPAGVVYADRAREVKGDYARCGFLSFETLDLKLAKDCPPELRGPIEADAQKLIARRGERFEISTSGQSVILGPSPTDPSTTARLAPTAKVRLQTVGREHARIAADLRVGDELVWNGGVTTRVAAIREASPQFLEIDEVSISGASSPRRLKKDRLVAVVAGAGGPNAHDEGLDEGLDANDDDEGLGGDAEGLDAGLDLDGDAEGLDAGLDLDDDAGDDLDAGLDDDAGDDLDAGLDDDAGGLDAGDAGTRAAGRDDFAERRAGRLARLQARARQKSREAEEHLNRSGRNLPDNGQPILVGHHSEHRHRRAIERSHSAMQRSVDADKEAKELLAQARGAASQRAISADDPDALPKLKQRLARLTRQRKAWLDANAASRSSKPRPALKALGFTNEETIRTLIRDRGFPAYFLTNSGAEVRRLTKRISELEERRHQPVPAPVTVGEYTAEWVAKDNRVTVSGPPPKSQAEKRRRSKLLRPAGFVFADSEDRWQRLANDQAWRIATGILEALASGE